MPVQVVQVIEIAGVVSIDALRRRGFFFRRLANGNVSRDEIKFVAIRPFRFGNLSIRVVVTSNGPRLVF